MANERSLPSGLTSAFFRKLWSQHLAWGSAEHLEKNRFAPLNVAERRESCGRLAQCDVARPEQAFAKVPSADAALLEPLAPWGVEASGF